MIEHVGVAHALFADHIAELEGTIVGVLEGRLAVVAGIHLRGGLVGRDLGAKINAIAPECILELVTVKLKRAPVFGKAFETDVEGDGGGGADVADGALLALPPVFLELRVELLELLDRLIRFVQQALGLPSPSNS